MFKKVFISICMAVIAMPIAVAQYSMWTFKVIDKETGEPLIGAAVELPVSSQGAVTNLAGTAVINNISKGEYQVKVSYFGYKLFLDTLTFPTLSGYTKIVMLPEARKLQDIVILISRTGRTIEKAPTRVEIIDAGELGEKAIMNSANIAVLLKESTGIQVQQTSATSGSKSIRIQGLDGRHTQLVQDGFPLFGGFSGGLSIMQIPPLDLQQVEVIKGSSSTLYGGGAIAGVVNLVTRKPEKERVLELMVDQTSALRTTLNSFYGQQKGQFGWTLYTSGNYQKVYDVDKDHFSEIPETRAISINPSLFWKLNDATKLRLAIKGTMESRLGGDIQVVSDRPDANHTYMDRNESQRISYQLNIDHRLSDHSRLNLKSGISYFDRSITVPNYAFSGKQAASFSELSYASYKKKSEWILGGNFYADQFEETSAGVSDKRGYSNNTVGMFSQFNRDLNSEIVLETGIRVDYNNQYGGFFLPRVSVLYKVSEKLSSRLGVGYGYKIPTIFTEETETINFRNVSPIDPNGLKPEKSQGLNFDINYIAKINNDWSFTTNQLFFYTQLDNTLLLRERVSGVLDLENANGAVNSRGFESNMKLTYKDFKLFANYAFVSTQLKYDNINKQKPLTPKHNIGSVLMFERKKKWRIGYELYYTGIQNRSDFSTTTDYIEMGLMIMRSWKQLSLYLNFENFTDTRQSRYESVSFSQHTDPGFREIWAPTEGRVVNGGFILRL